MSEIPEEIERAVAAGVNGYLLKASGSEELITAIKMVAHGNSYYGASVINSFVKNVRNPAPTSSKGLTPTETKIVQMLYEEKKTPGNNGCLGMHHQYPHHPFSKHVQEA